jgi:Tfp pilus assembly protein PilF
MSEMLFAEQYKKFSDARQARRTGAPQQAIPLLKEVLVQEPNFYLGWYNHALTYAKANEELPARHTYKRAIDLEPSQFVRDSSV